MLKQNVAICVSGIPNKAIGLTIENQKSVFKDYDFFFHTWEGYSYPHEFQSTNVEKYKNLVKNNDLEERPFLSFLSHYKCVENLPKRYTTIVRIKNDVVFRTDCLEDLEKYITEVQEKGNVISLGDNQEDEIFVIENTLKSKEWMYTGFFIHQRENILNPLKNLSLFKKKEHTVYMNSYYNSFTGDKRNINFYGHFDNLESYIDEFYLSLAYDVVKNEGFEMNLKTAEFIKKDYRDYNLTKNSFLCDLVYKEAVDRIKNFYMIWDKT